MGVVPSTPRNNSRPQDTAEFLIASFVGEKSFPLSSDFWKKLLEIPLTLQWPQERILQACHAFAQNNCRTGHLAKILVHLVWCLQESMSSSGVSIVYSKTINAAYISAVFMKYVIEKSESDNFEELNLCLHESDATHPGLPEGQSIENFVMHGVLTFIGTIDVSSHTYALHHELLNLLLVALSTQLCSRASPGPNDVHPFLDAAMSQDSTLVSSVVLRLLQNYIVRPYIPQNEMSYAVFSKGKQPGVLQKVGTVAATFVLLPYYTFNYLLSTSGDGLRSSLADNSLLVLLVLVHHQKLIMTDGDGINKVESDMNESIHPKELSCFYDNPYRKALENARDIEFDRVDIEGNAHNGPIVRLPFASLFDTLGMFLADESSVLLLYSLLHGNSDFLEYVLVRTDLDTLLMPILETLYNASKKTSNQIYMLLIILLILSQDSSFNASIHKLILPSIPWYKERLLHNTSLGSLTVIVLIRTVKYNLSKLRDIYLHTNCLATLANMAPHVHKLSAYASQRLVSLFDMLSRKYAKLADLMNDKMLKIKVDSETLGDMVDDTSTELHIYTDFLRIVLEILNAILTYALPRNPEVVYAIMHRQEVFLPFKCHPRFNELLENIYTVLDFFNSRMDAQQVDGEWSVEKVLQVIINNCRSWRGDGLKMFTQLRFTYEQENHPEEFFIPYVWQLILIHSNFNFDPNAITLFPTELPVEVSPTEDVIRVSNLEV